MNEKVVANTFANSVYGVIVKAEKNDENVKQVG